MYNQIVYGSLLHPKELQRHGISLDSIEFVKVSNFQRVFNQEPSHRNADSINRAVLNIQKVENSFFNAILIKNISEKSLQELDIREKGYDRLNLEDGLVRYYTDNKIAKDCFVYIGKKGKQNEQILPNISYLKLCLNGSRSYFDEFYNDFINTTYQNTNGGLKVINYI